MPPVADIVYEAARRVAVDGIVTLPLIQADPGVRRYVCTPSRVIDLMAQLADQGRVRMTATHPVRKWRIEEQR